MTPKEERPYRGWISSVDRRRAERVKPSSVDARYSSADNIEMCEIDDLSEDGARMSADLPVGTEVLLELFLPDDRSVSTVARVVHRVYPDHGVGLIFDGLDDRNRSALRELLEASRQRAH